MKQITDEEFEKYEYALNTVESMENINYILEQITFQQNPEYISSGVGNLCTLKEVKLPKEGGILCFYNEHIYPRKGFPAEMIVEKTDSVKKIISVLVHSLSGSKIVTLFLLLFCRKELDKVYNQFLIKLRDVIGYSVLWPYRYCKSVQEISKAFGPEDDKLKVIVATILEFDDAYRYRIQDILGELDKEKFRASPYKELTRLVCLIQFRENDQRLKETWMKVGKLLFGIFLFKSLREKIVMFFSKLNPENIQLDEADLYYAKMKIGGYRWGEHKSLVS